MKMLYTNQLRSPARLIAAISKPTYLTLGVLKENKEQLYLLDSRLQYIGHIYIIKLVKKNPPNARYKIMVKKSKNHFIISISVKILTNNPYKRKGEAFGFFCYEY